MSNCLLCNSKTQVILDLGQQPLANDLLNNQNSDCKTFPLTLARCPICNHIQLKERIAPEELFSNYAWITGTSKGANNFSKVLFSEIYSKQTDINKVLEIASNDGTFLKPFKKAGYSVLGVDPAKNIAEIASANGKYDLCKMSKRVT